VLMRILYSLFKAFVVVPLAPLGGRAVNPLKGTVRSNNGRRFRRDVWKVLCNDEVISDYRSTDFRDAPHVACTTPVFIALLTPAPTSNLLLLTLRGRVLADRFTFSRFFAALIAVSTADTCEARSTSRSRVPRVLLGFVFSGFVLLAQIGIGSVFPYIIQIIRLTLGDKSFGSSYLLVTVFFCMPVAREDGCATICSTSSRFKAVTVDGPRPLEHSGVHAYVYSSHL
jgi:hypothetical protein